ncbi:MAG: hypothetical protein M1835_004629 [Candelina submexicana]|nr:MAG: hypothetical protein M1835_004629 [Candelina submexicana]
MQIDSDRKQRKRPSTRRHKSNFRETIESPTEKSVERRPGLSHPGNAHSSLKRSHKASAVGGHERTSDKGNSRPRKSGEPKEAEKDAAVAANAATTEPVTGLAASELLRSSGRNAETNAEQVPVFPAHLTSMEQGFGDIESYAYSISQRDVADIFRQWDKAFNVPKTNMNLTTQTKFPEPNTNEAQTQTKKRQQEQADTIKQDFKQRRSPDNHRNASAQPIQIVYNNHLLDRSQSSSEASTIELSPLRDVSLDNSWHMWDQLLRQYEPSSTELATPKTTSPKDAIHEFQESEGGTPPFPLNASSNATSQDQTPDYQFEPPIIDPNAYAFDPFANQPPEYYTATPRGDNTLDYGEAGNLSSFAPQNSHLVDFPILELEDGDNT